MVSRPFLFLGSGVGRTAFEIYVGSGKPGADHLRKAVKASFVGSARQRVEEADSVVRLKGTFPKGSTSHVTEMLQLVHAAWPLSLVVRTNRVATDGWHRDSVNDPNALLDALGQVLDSAKGLYEPFERSLGGFDSIHQAAYQQLAGASVLGGFAQATLKVASQAMKKPPASEVWHDVLVARLPEWMGKDFAVDLALQQKLSATLGVSPSGVSMPARFSQTLADMTQRWLEGQHASRARAHEEAVWSSADSVRAELSKGPSELARLESNFLDTSQAHVEVLLRLTHDERVLLSQRRTMVTLMMNAATNLLMRGAFEASLSVYDAALEGAFPAEAAANPLYAVQDDNHHLGIDAERARRYLKKCLPHGPANPTVFSNGALVAAELGDFELAMHLLHEAKARGIAVSRDRNERLYAPLRERADFKKLMR